jgi:hypothetical protein
VDGDEMIAQQALLFLTDVVSFQYVLPTLCAYRYERHARRVASM